MIFKKIVLLLIIFTSTHSFANSSDTNYSYLSKEQIDAHFDRYAVRRNNPGLCVCSAVIDGIKYPIATSPSDAAPLNYTYGDKTMEERENDFYKYLVKALEKIGIDVDEIKEKLPQLENRNHFLTFVKETSCRLTSYVVNSNIPREVLEAPRVCEIRVNKNFREDLRHLRWMIARDPSVLDSPEAKLEDTGVFYALPESDNNM